MPPPPDSTDEPTCSGCSQSYEVKNRCTKCKAAFYCSASCQTQHWPTHKPICRPYSPGEVWAIKVLANGELKSRGLLVGADSNPGVRFAHFLLQGGHPALTRSELCTSTKAYGLPLRIYSHAIATGVPDTPNADGDGNQPAVYLRVEPHDGMAPFHWQLNSPGTCIVYREDKKPLTRELIEAVWKFHSILLHSPVFEPSGWANPMNPATWQFFVRDYYTQQREKGRTGFVPFYKPL